MNDRKLSTRCEQFPKISYRKGGMRPIADDFTFRSDTWTYRRGVAGGGGGGGGARARRPPLAPSPSPSFSPLPPPPPLPLFVSSCSSEPTPRSRRRCTRSFQAHGKYS